jgi:polyferredoxin
VTAFFFVPLVFTLFFGRTFCAAVCPLGAVQDVVLLKPLRIPAPLEAALRLIAWLYLSLAILLAATASSMIICRYDPFVSFFRFNANAALWVISISMLVIAVFVGRPYCRFLCPYGLIFRQIGRISRSRVTITPDACIQCRLCEDACPFGAIEKPTVQWPQAEHAKGKRLLLLLILCLPLLIAGGTYLGYKLHPKLAQAHPDVALANRIRLEQDGVYTERTDASEAFYESTQSQEQLEEKAAAKQKQFAAGASIVGGWMGLVAGISLIQYSIFWKRSDYQAHRAGCFACGRCYNACPQHRLWLKNKKTGQNTLASR